MFMNVVDKMQILEFRRGIGGYRYSNMQIDFNRILMGE